MNGISCGFWASSSCWAELRTKALRYSVLKSDSCWLIHDQRQPEMAGATGEIVGVLAGLVAADQTPRLVN